MLHILPSESRFVIYQARKGWTLEYYRTKESDAERHIAPDAVELGKLVHILALSQDPQPIPPPVFGRFVPYTEEELAKMNEVTE